MGAEAAQQVIALSGTNQSATSLGPEYLAPQKWIAVIYLSSIKGRVGYVASGALRNELTRSVYQILHSVMTQMNCLESQRGGLDFFHKTRKAAKSSNCAMNDGDVQSGCSKHHDPWFKHSRRSWMLDVFHSS